MKRQYSNNQTVIKKCSHVVRCSSTFLNFIGMHIQYTYYMVPMYLYLYTLYTILSYYLTTGYKNSLRIALNTVFV